MNPEEIKQARAVIDSIRNGEPLRPLVAAFPAQEPTMEERYGIEPGHQPTLAEQYGIEPQPEAKTNSDPSAESIATEAAREICDQWIARGDRREENADDKIAAIIQSAISRAEEELTAKLAEREAYISALGDKVKEHREAAEERERRMREALTDIIKSARNCNEPGQTWVTIAGGLIDDAELRVSEAPVPGEVGNGQ